MIFPVPYAMTGRGVFNVPVVGVAASKWDLAKLLKRAKDSIKQAGKIDDQDASSHTFPCFGIWAVLTMTQAHSRYSSRRWGMSGALHITSPSQLRCSRQ